MTCCPGSAQVRQPAKFLKGLRSVVVTVLVVRSFRHSESINSIILERSMGLSRCATIVLMRSYPLAGPSPGLPASASPGGFSLPQVALPRKPFFGHLPWHGLAPRFAWCLPKSRTYWRIGTYQGWCSSRSSPGSAVISQPCPSFGHSPERTFGRVPQKPCVQLQNTPPCRDGKP